MQTTSSSLQRPCLGKLLVLATKQATFPFWGVLCSEAHLRKGILSVSSASLRFHSGPPNRGGSFGLCLTLLFSYTFTGIGAHGFYRQALCSGGPGGQTAPSCVVTLRTHSFGGKALDFDLQAPCCGWKVKEGSDSSSWRKPGGPDQIFQSRVASWAFFPSAWPK